MRPGWKELSQVLAPKKAFRRTADGKTILFDQGRWHIWKGLDWWLLLHEGEGIEMTPDNAMKRADEKYPVKEVK